MNTNRTNPIKSFFAEFAGMIESDGSFYVEMEKDSSTRGGRKLGYRTRACIIFNQKNETVTNLLTELKSNFGGTIKDGRYKVSNLAKLLEIVPKLLPFFRGEKGLDGFWFLEALKLMNEPFEKGPGGGRQLEYYLRFVDIMYNINSGGSNRPMSKTDWYSLIKEKVDGFSDDVQLKIVHQYAVAFKNYQLNYSKRFQNPLSAAFLVGITSGDGSISMVIGIDDSMRFGLRFRPSYSITLLNSQENLKFLENVKAYFLTGSIFIQKNTLRFKVQSSDDLLKIIFPFFKKYPLIPGDKRAEQLLVIEQATNLLKKAKTSEDYIEIVNLVYDLHEPVNRRKTKAELIQIILNKEKQ